MNKETDNLLAMEIGCPCSKCEAMRKERGLPTLWKESPTYVATPRAPGAPDMSDSYFSDLTVTPNPSAQGLLAFGEEYRKARAKHGPMNSAHEGYAVILEELDELKAHVWQKQKERNYAEMRREVVQLGAMALAFLVEIVDTENRK